MTRNSPLCPEFKNLDWFSDNPEEQKVCKEVCNQCPVKFECAQLALERKEAWGIWGGMDDFRVRRALGVDSMERERKYVKDLYCPFCFSTNLLLPSKKSHNATANYEIQCNDCKIEWTTTHLPDKTRKLVDRTPHVGHRLESVSK